MAKETFICSYLPIIASLTHQLIYQNLYPIECPCIELYSLWYRYLCDTSLEMVYPPNMIRNHYNDIGWLLVATNYMKVCCSSVHRENIRRYLLKYLSIRNFAHFVKWSFHSFTYKARPTTNIYMYVKNILKQYPQRKTTFSYILKKKTLISSQCYSLENRNTFLI